MAASNEEFLKSYRALIAKLLARLDAEMSSSYLGETTSIAASILLSLVQGYSQLSLEIKPLAPPPLPPPPPPPPPQKFPPTESVKEERQKRVEQILAELAAAMQNKE